MARSRRHRRFIGMRIIIFLGLTFMTSAVALLFFAKAEERITAEGVVQPFDPEEVRAVMGGVLVDVCCEDGDIIEAGHIMARYDDKLLKDKLAEKEQALEKSSARVEIARKRLAQLEKNALPEKLQTADIEVRKAKRRAELRESDLKRVRELFEHGLASAQEVENARTNYQLAVSDLEIAQKKQKIVASGLEKSIIEVAKAELKLAEEERNGLYEDIKRLKDDIERTLVKAPASGKVILATKEDGEAVRAGEIIFVIATCDKKELEVKVPEDKILKVSEGQPVRIYSSVFSYQKYGICSGVVQEVSNCAEEGNKFKVKVLVTDSPLPLKVGSTAQARIIVARRGILDMILDRG